VTTARRGAGLDSRHLFRMKALGNLTGRMGLRRNAVQSGNTHTTGRAAGRRAAFTIVELIVVIALVVIVLALAIPGLNVLNAQARLSGASQTLNVALTRAYYTAVADVNMAALRLLPGDWDISEQTGLAGAPGRQHAVVYSYTGVAYDPDNPQPNVVRFKEYFSRRAGVDAVVLPEDVWAAPVEALSNERAVIGQVTYNPLGTNLVLNGRIGQFRYNAEQVGGSDGQSGDLLNADDFLLVVDPKVGLGTARPRPYALRAYAPAAGYEVYRDPAAPNNPARDYQRFGFSGLVLYRREPFVALGPYGGTNGVAEARQDFLREKGRAYLAQRYGGGLSAARPRPQ